MTDFQAIVENALNDDNVEDSEMDTTIDKFSHWHWICATGIAAVSAGCIAWLQLAAAADVPLESVGKNIASSMEHLSRAIVESADILANKVPRPHPNNTDLFNAVHSLDLPEDYLLDCYELLSKHDAEANMFLGTTQQYRAAMLTRIMKSR